jgi:Domain of unknown function (DUF4331)
MRNDRSSDDEHVIVKDAPVSTGYETKVTGANGYRFFAGWRSDPFFFDTNGALNNLEFTGTDFFAEKNICSIALEVPNTNLGSGKLLLWARTLDGTSGRYVQADRGARASQEPFLAGDEKSAYLSGDGLKPHTDLLGDFPYVGAPHAAAVHLAHASRNRSSPRPS